MSKESQDFHQAFASDPNPLARYVFTVFLGIPELVLQQALTTADPEATKLVLTIAAKYNQKSYLTLCQDFVRITDEKKKILAWNRLTVERCINLGKTLQFAGFNVNVTENMVNQIHADVFAMMYNFVLEKTGTKPMIEDQNELPMTGQTVLRSILVSGIIPTPVLNDIVAYSNGMIYSRGAGSGYYETALLKCGAKNCCLRGFF